MRVCMWSHVCVCVCVCVFAETALALMRHPSQWLYAGSESRTLNSSRAAERAFNSATLEQRSRIEEETLVNTNGRKPVVKTLSRGKGWCTHTHTHTQTYQYASCTHTETHTQQTITARHKAL